MPRTGPKEGTPWVHAQRQDHKLVRLRRGCSHTRVHASPRLGTAQESPRQAETRASGQTSLLTDGGSHASQPHEESAQSDPSQDPRTQLYHSWGSWRPRPPPSKGPAWGRVNAAFTPEVCAPPETSALAPVDEIPLTGLRGAGLAKQLLLRLHLHLHWSHLWETGRNHCDAKGALDSRSDRREGGRSLTEEPGAQGRASCPPRHSTGRPPPQGAMLSPNCPQFPVGGGCSTSRIWELTVNSCYKFTSK